MARPERFELPTSWFVAMRSIQLSYGRSTDLADGSEPPIHPPRPCAAHLHEPEPGQRGHVAGGTGVGGRFEAASTLRAFP